MEEDLNPLGLDDYDYPQIYIHKNMVEICLGWFFVGKDDDETASYVYQYIDSNLKYRFVIDVNMSFAFDFTIKLKDYGHWIHPTRLDEEAGDKPYFVYADNHLRNRDVLKHIIKNFPFRYKRWLYFHLKLYRRVSTWHYQRYCKKLFEVKK